MFLQTLLKKVKREDGFTLVELLIVVAIIAILAAIAIPQFSAYRKRGYAATINSDAKNAYTATMAVIADNPAISTMGTACAEQANAGYQPSAGIGCIMSFTSISTFSIEVGGLAAWGLSGPSASIDQSGALSKAMP